MSSDTRTMAENMLLGLGVNPGFRGFTHLCIAVDLCLADPSLVQAVTKELYPHIAGTLGKGETSARVERCIRHAVSQAVVSSLRRWERLFHRRLAKPPTNKHVIAALVTAVQQEVRAAGASQAS